MPLNGYIYLFVLAAGDLVLYDLVPVFSYAIQYAKCRYCQAKIAKQ
jgi:prepilin signal peptidase PulO-like enzyme (type II secretory pathway)